MESKNILFEEVKDEKILTQKGILSVPQLEADGKLLNFEQANAYINNL